MLTRRRIVKKGPSEGRIREDGLTTTMVNVSLSSLGAELHASLSAMQWVTSGYLLALALMLPLNGWLVERIGAKALYLSCFAAFTLSSALCGVAWSANALIAFRILQGMSGGLMAPMTQMMIARAAGKHMARVIGYAAVPVMLGPLLGPVIAGAILQYASWRWLFLVNLPVGAVAIILAIFLLPSDREETKHRDLDLVVVCPTLPRPWAWQPQRVADHAALRTRRTLGPTDGFQMRNTGFLIRKAIDEIHQVHADNNGISAD